MQEFWIQTGQATCSLPEPVTLTPALGEVCACKDRLNGCPTASNLWQQKGWKQLNLQKDGSDGYHYALERDGDRLWMIMPNGLSRKRPTMILESSMPNY